MALTSSQLTELVRKAKIHLRIKDNDPDFLVGAMTIFHDKGTSATAATASLSAETLTLIITGGANAGTTAIDLSAAANDTVDELVTAINTLGIGFVARVVGNTSAASIDLLPFAATSIYGSNNEKDLEVESNALLEIIIEETYESIVAECDRHFLDASYDERTSIDTVGTAVLKEPDVSSIHFVGSETRESLKIQYTGSDQSARVEVTDTELIVTSSEGSTDSQTTFSLTASAYDTVSELVSAVTGTTDWSATLITDGPSKYLIRQPSRSLKDRGQSTETTFDAWEPYDGEYNVWYEAGILKMNGALSGIARVVYRAGTANLPRPVERELFRLVKLAYEVSSLNSAVTTERLGDYSRQTAVAAVQQSLDVGDSTRDRLSKYVRMIP